MRKFRVTSAALAGAATISLAFAGQATAASTPKIVAHPASVMVNTATKLFGYNFPADSKLTIEECSKTGWIVPQNPCDTTNEIHVTTNSAGSFVHKLTAQVCPGGVTKLPGFQEICYVGEPKPSGIDTVFLVGAAKITVTGP